MRRQRNEKKPARAQKDEAVPRGRLFMPGARMIKLMAAPVATDDDTETLKLQATIQRGTAKTSGKSQGVGARMLCGLEPPVPRAQGRTGTRKKQASGHHVIGRQGPDGPSRSDSTRRTPESFRPSVGGHASPPAGITLLLNLHIFRGRFGPKFGSVGALGPGLRFLNKDRIAWEFRALTTHFHLSPPRI